MGLFSRNKKKDNPFEDEWGLKDVPYDTEEQRMKNAGIFPVTGRKRRARTIEEFAVKVIIILVVAFVALSLFSALRSGYRIEKVDERISTLESPAFKSQYNELGQSIIRAYYLSEEAPVNLMSGVSWERTSLGSSDYETGETSRDEQPKINVTNLALIRTPQTINVQASKENNSVFTNPRSEVLVYSGYVDGKLYEFSVNLIIPNVDDPTTLPYLASPPTMMPVPTMIQAEEANIDTPPIGGDSLYSNITLNESSISTITSWASAYAQDDGDTIKRLAGDNNITHDYKGLGGFSLEGNPSIVWAFQYNNKGDDDVTNDAIIARVNFNISREVQNNSSDAESEILGERSGKFVQSQTMDIMLTNFSQGTPDLSAWSPAGSWATLTPYMNATVITGTETDTETETPSSPQSDDDSSESAPSAPSIETSSRESSGNSSPSSSSRSSRPTSSSR